MPYAELTSARCDGHAVDLSRPLKRLVAMTISGLRAYGGKWQRWVNTATGQKHPRFIPMKHRDKGVMQQDADGSYEISTVLMRAVNTLGIR